MFLIRLFLFFLPFMYMALIWIQTSKFDPESVYMLSTQIHMAVLYIIGFGLELAHFFEFGLLYLFLVMAFLIFGKLSQGKELIATVLAIGYGLVDELHQYFIPFRSFSIVDLLKNGIGVLVMWYFLRLKYYKKDSKIGLLLKKITYLRKGTKDLPF